MRKTYTGMITKLEPNQIFVFGSNTEGRHGAGAALAAHKYFGAIYGQAEGLQGQSYGLITVDLNKNSRPSIGPKDIIKKVRVLYRYAKANKDKEYLIAYNAEGNNLNGYTPKQMVKMFDFGNIIPDNIVFEEGFNNLIFNS